MFAQKQLTLPLRFKHVYTTIKAIEVRIHDFQEMMKQLYLTRDQARGVEATFNWLADELQELKEALDGKDKEALAKEFADDLAWLASLANITGVDLEKAAVNKYNNMCPKCKRSPCQCEFIKSKPNASAQNP
jgi:NTP pyrophosphatase (non-canonical NTP hydrolase)